MTEPQNFCLRWSSYTQQLSEALRTLFDRELLVDVTLACDGKSLRAHRAVLSACSSYFQDLFQESTHPHPIVILKDVQYQELEALVKFMYHGEVTVNNDALPSFLRTAETLHIRGLTDSTFSGNSSPTNPLKVLNGSHRSHDEVGSVADQEESSRSTQRLSPVPMKRIKIEQPTSSHYLQSSRLPSHQQTISASLNGNNTGEDGIVSEQEPHCSMRSEELPHLNQDPFNVQRSITSHDGLSQLVLPVLQEESPHNSQYVGVCHSLANQHHPISQPHQSMQPHHHQAQHNTGPGTSSSAASRPFRQRVLYNQEQLLQLEAWYRQDRYPSGALMREYADTLAAMVPSTPGSLGAQPMRQNVDYWFQNRRRKDFHPEVMQQREKKKFARTLWGNYEGNISTAPTNSSPGNSSTNVHTESEGSNSNR